MKEINSFSIDSISEIRPLLRENNDYHLINVSHNINLTLKKESLKEELEDWIDYNLDDTIHDEGVTETSTLIVHCKENDFKYICIFEASGDDEDTLAYDTNIFYFDKLEE